LASIKIVEFLVDATYHLAATQCSMSFSGSRFGELFTGEIKNVNKFRNIKGNNSIRDSTCAMQ
jgi:hypothetical protein